MQVGGEETDEAKAATKLQALQRSKQVRKVKQQEAESAAKMQAARRGYAARKQRAEMGASASKVQAGFRGKAARKARREEKMAATRVQAMTRGKKTRETANKVDVKKLFESIDTDGSGTLSRKELANKLKKDDELETLLGLKGAKRIGKHFMRIQKELEGLDGDGDANLTFDEFAKLFSYVSPPSGPLPDVSEG